MNHSGTRAAPTRTITRSIRCSPELWERFRVAARANLSTRSTVAEALITGYVEEYETSLREAA